ncbi:hypothetical protein LXL04_035315 [Taraxacum kok-saghyz]
MDKYNVGMRVEIVGHSDGFWNSYYKFEFKAEVRIQGRNRSAIEDTRSAIEDSTRSTKAEVRIQGKSRSAIEDSTRSTKTSFIEDSTLFQFKDAELEEEMDDIDVVEVDVKVEGEEANTKVERERWSVVWNYFKRLPIGPDEPRSDIGEDLDVLSFWKAHQYRYPELALMARDILSIPVSTVASESAFSNGGRVLDQYRSSLDHDIVEALICSKDWLFGIKGDEELCLQELTDDIMEEENKK